MKTRSGLGRLNVTHDRGGRAPASSRRTKRPNRPLIAGVVVLAICAIAVWGGKVAAEQIVPRRVVVRGCWLTSSDEILSAVGFNGMQSVAEMRTAAREYAFEKSRWLCGIRISQDSLATALVTVMERVPLLRLKVNDDQYWLCDDGTAVALDSDVDIGPVFDAIRELPVIEMQVTSIQQLSSLTVPALETAALCQEVLAGKISRITVDSTSEIDLYDKSGFRIRLGQPELLAEKIGALPKALRICEQNENSLQYLDARDPQVFYEKWDEPINR